MLFRGSHNYIPLPTGLDHTWQFTFKRHFPKAEAAHAEPADIGPGPSAQRAAVVRPHLELWFAFCLDGQTFLSHI